MIEIAYQRITKFCRSDMPGAENNQNEELVLDAWSFIDVLKRLRSVLEHTPGLRQGKTLSNFLEATQPVVDFRHHHQHIENKVAGIAPSGRPIWGTFSWAVADRESKRVRVGVYLPGRVAKTEGVPAVNPAGLAFRSDVDHFQVTLGDQTLKLSELYYLTQPFTEAFNAALSDAGLKEMASGETILSIDLDNPPAAA